MNMEIKIEKNNMIMGASVRMVLPITAELADTLGVNADAGTKIVVYDIGFTAVVKDEEHREAIIKRLTLKERRTAPLFPVTVDGVEIKNYTDALRYLNLKKRNNTSARQDGGKGVNQQYKGGKQMSRIYAELFPFM